MAKKLTSSKAKEILHDKSVHGHPLTDKQRKFFGAIAGGAKPYPTAQNGIEGTMGGLTDVGFDYNGAWNGQFQMGGSLPGAVGFMYARTISPAPANGKYTKKTKASAQNGKEMKYWQDGLDFKPKTISKKGSKIIKDPKGQWAHPGEITEIPSNEITMQGVPYPVLGISDTGHQQMMYPGQDYTYDGNSVTEYPMMQEGGSIQDKGQLLKLDQLTNFTNYNDMAKAKQGKKLKKAQGGGSWATAGIPAFSTATYDASTGLVNNASGSVSQADMASLGFGKNAPGAGGGFASAAGAVGMGLLTGLPQIIGGIDAIGQQKQNIKRQERAGKISGLAAQAAGTRDVQKRKYVRPEDILIQPGQLGSPSGVGTNYLAKNGTEIQNTYNPPLNLYSDLGYEPLNDSNVKQYRRGGNIPTAELGDYFQDSGQAQIGSAVGSAIGNAILPGVGGAIGGLLGKVGGNLFGGAEDANRLAREKEKTETNQAQAAWSSSLQSGKYSKFMEDGGWVSNDWQPQVITQFGEHKVKDLLKPPHDADMLRAGGHLKEYTPPSAAAMFTGRAQAGTVLDSNIRSKTDLQSTTDNGMFSQDLRHAISSVDTYADGRPVEKTDLYSITKGKGDNQRVKEFLRSQVGDQAPQYSMQKTYKPLFGSQYKTVSKEIGAGRGERRMADMEQFLGNMEDGGQMAMGGELQTHWGGYMAPMSQNPNLPGDGVVYMPHGQSHEESNGKGQSGIGITYGKNPVEVERGEPIVKLQDGGTGGESAHVFGNIKINKTFSGLLEDKKAEGMKFKTYVADIAKNDAKQLKVIDKGMELINENKGRSAIDQLKMNSGMAKVMGGKAYQKINADKIQTAAAVQSAIHSTASKMGVDPAALAEGKIVKDKNAANAAFGGKFTKAQDGVMAPKQQTPKEFVSDLMKGIMSNIPSANDEYVNIPYQYGYSDTPLEEVTVTSTKPSKVSSDISNINTPTSTKSKFDWKGLGEMALSNIAPFLRPSNQQPLDPEQLFPEYLSLATNQLEPVQAQTFEPTLLTPYDVSLQDQLNEVDSQVRSATRMLGSNPAAASTIFAQAEQAKNRIRGEQFRMNQATKNQVYNQNVAKMDQAKLQNLQILDNQYVRQAQAKSNTKAQALEAVKSIAAKTLANKLENRQLGIMENLYNYRFTPRGVAYNVNAPAQFNIPTTSLPDPNLTDNTPTGDLLPIYGNKGNITGYKVKQADTKTKRNGAIVKALKNL